MPNILRSTITYKHPVNNTNSTIKITISKKKDTKFLQYTFVRTSQEQLQLSPNSSSITKIITQLRSWVLGFIPESSPDFISL